MTLQPQNGTHMRAFGPLETTIKVGSQLVSYAVVHSDQISWDAIIGVDFLRHCGAVIDLVGGAVSIASEVLSLQPSPKKCTEAVFSLDVQPENLARQIEAAVQTSDGTPADLTKLKTLLHDCASSFAWTGTPLGRTNVLQHKIDTGTAAPCRQRARRVPAQHRAALQEMIEKMLEDGVIRPSTSPWAAPIVLVKKKNGTLRLCVDYRKLNSITRKDSFPIPRIDDILDSLGGATWFATLDLASGYWQVELDPTDQEKTAFAIPTGLYEFTTMPFGLANAPATFQRLMQMVLQDLTPSTCLVYLDDVIVFGRNSDTLLENVRNVLHRLEQAGLRLQPSKCTFMQRKVAFLGHVIGPEGVHTDPSKVAVVREWPTPQSAEEVRKFLGLASYYRRFVKNFSTIAAPLNRLTEKGRKFAWSPACEDAFVTLRASLTTTPTLAFPDFSEDGGQFTLDTDAIDTGIRAVLSKIGQDAAEHVIAYGS